MAKELSIRNFEDDWISIEKHIIISFNTIICAYNGRPGSQVHAQGLMFIDYHRPGNSDLAELRCNITELQVLYIQMLRNFDKRRYMDKFKKGKSKAHQQDIEKLNLKIKKISEDIFYAKLKY